jgi:hypothetical protein
MTRSVCGDALSATLGYRIMFCGAHARISRARASPYAAAIAASYSGTAE